MSESDSSQNKVGNVCSFSLDTDTLLFSLARVAGAEEGAELSTLCGTFGCRRRSSRREHSTATPRPTPARARARRPTGPPPRKLTPLSNPREGRGYWRTRLLQIRPRYEQQHLPSDPHPYPDLIIMIIILTITGRMGLMAARRRFAPSTRGSGC